MSEIVIVATLNVKEAHQQELMPELLALIEKSRQEVGNIKYDLHQDMSQPNILVFVEVWASQQAVDAHNQTAHFKQFVQVTEGKLNSLEIKLLNKIA
ncbi:putative quinol monooxygenase [Neisseria sp. Ec49-e6-T10]|uniref:putative quinol monooxygenase n=1 Tax=Neisseria sp. Ec49-e6-T10 TaxID=3140744 RepID=UPI003EBEED10